MKRALAGLTTRGRSFVAAGLTAIACAFVLGERDLLRAGVLVLSLPLLSALTVSRTRYRLACARKLTPARVTVGQEARVRLRLKNVSRLPTGLLLVEDRVPYTLGGRARFLLDRVEPHGARDLGYRVRSEVRGRYRVGPLVVRLADPFGLVELGRSFRLADSLTVLPQVVPLRPATLTGSRAGGADAVARRMATAGEDDVGAREYRHGDDLRRVHWRSTARRGELMVRREEQHSQNTGALLLDTRRRAYRGEGAAAPFEQAVSAAASIAVHLVRAGVDLRLVTDTGRPPVSPGAAGGTLEAALLDALAVIRRSDGRSLSPGLAALRTGNGGERADNGLLVAVFGALTTEEARAVAAAGRGGAGCVAVLIDAGPAVGGQRADGGGATGTGEPGSRAGGPGTIGSGPGGRRPVPARPSAGNGSAGDPPDSAPTGAARLLRTAGWHVIMVSSAAELGTAWASPGATRSPGAAAAAPGEPNTPAGAWRPDRPEHTTPTAEHR